MDDCLINRKTGFAVKKSGKIGQAILANAGNTGSIKEPKPKVARVPKVKAVKEPKPVSVKAVSLKPVPPKVPKPKAVLTAMARVNKMAKEVKAKMPKPPKEPKPKVARAPKVAFVKAIEKLIKEESEKGSITPSFSPITERKLRTIYDRTKEYNDYIAFFQKYGDADCLTIAKEGENHIFTTANKKIKLIRRIGSDSAYGAIYLSNIVEKSKQFVFASKIMPQTADNQKEIGILSKLSNFAIADINPHFPIMFHNFSCNFPSNLAKLPKVALKKKYFMNLNELASGDLKQFMVDNYGNAKLLKNALAQIYISILSYHRQIGYFHNDAHWGNFLFHKITPQAGQYFKYTIFGKDVYIENQGYLWVIWDYGLSKKLDKSNSLNVIKDYSRVINAFANIKDRGWIDNKKVIPVETLKLVTQIERSFFESQGNDAEVPFFNSIIDTTDLFNSPVFINNINPSAYVIN
jgi:thiamine kinase-like enzyme